MKRTRLAPAPEPHYPNLIPDGRDLGPENVFLPPATRGRHPPPETNTLGQHAVLPLPAKAMPSRGACWHGDTLARGDGKEHQRPGCGRPRMVVTIQGN
jgi:hypothetical protein